MLTPVSRAECERKRTSIREIEEYEMPVKEHGGGNVKTCNHFMGELTAQVGISEFSKKEDCKTWYENERVCGQVSYET